MRTLGGGISISEIPQSKDILYKMSFDSPLCKGAFGISEREEPYENHRQKKGL